MDVLRLDLFYWKLIQTFVVRDGMRVVEFNPNEREIILEQEEGKEKKFIRLVRMDIDWSNQLKKDLNLAANKLEIIRKNFFYKDLYVENIYVSMYPPLDSPDHIIGKTVAVGKQNKTKITSYLYTNDDSDTSIYHFFKERDQQVPSFIIDETVSSFEVEIIKQSVKTAIQDQLDKEKALFSFRKPKITYVLLIIIGMMFAILEFNGGSTQVNVLIDFGAKYNPLIDEGEWWRFITAMFLHIGLLHLIMNSLALFYLGNIVERIYGSFRFLLIYFVAGIFGSISSYAFNVQVSAGASGAIFGLFGALLYFGVIHRKLFFRTIGINVIIILIINIVIGFTIPIIDNSAHLGGLVGGFLASFIVHLPKHKQGARQVVYFVLTSMILVGLLFFGMTNENKTGSHIIALQYAQELLQQDKFNQAYPILIEIIESEKDIPEAYFLLAYTEAHLEKYSDAKENLLKVIDLRPSFHEAHYNLALVYVELNEYEKALISVERALSIESNEAYEILHTKLKQN